MSSGRASFPGEVFVSHASANRRFADKLCRELGRHGAKFWYSKRHIAGAQQWHDEIGKALERCDWFVLLLSPQAVKFRWVKHELLFALNDSRYEQKIVPCVYRDCDFKPLSWTLSNFLFISFTAGMETGIRELLRLWGVAYQPVAVASPKKSARKPPPTRKRKRK